MAGAIREQKERVGDGGRPVRIVLISHYFPPHVGGIEYVAQNQAKYLAEYGHKVSVVSSAIDAKRGVRQQDGYKVFRIAASNVMERKTGVPFPIFSPKLLTQTYSLVKQADIVHIHDAFYLSSLVAAFWAWLLRKPLVLNQHVAVVPHPSKLVNAAQKLVYSTSGRFIFHKSYRIIILNADVENFLIKRGVSKDKIVFIPNGVDTKMFHPANPSEKAAIRKKYKLPTKKPLALFVGRFVPKKGFDLLLKAGSPGYIIVFVGGVAPKGYKESSEFIFLGRRESGETAEIYRACDLFVLPSQGEGFPLSVQEAMASSLPVITSKEKGYSLYNFDAKRICMIQPTVSQIRKHLSKLAADKMTTKPMSEYSVRYARQYFDWGIAIKKLNRIYGSTS